MKIRGYRIELGEVEAALAAVAGVTASVVVTQSERLVAYAVATVGAVELREALKAKLPEYMVPSAFVLLEALPLMPSGKVDRRALPAPEAARRLASYVAPRTADEAAAGEHLARGARLRARRRRTTTSSSSAATRCWRRR